MCGKRLIARQTLVDHRHKHSKDATRPMPASSERDIRQNSMVTHTRPYSTAQAVGLALGPSLFALTMLFFAPEELGYAGRVVLATTLWVATWWITEAIPIPATSLLPLVLLPVFGALDSATVTASYGNDIIFLFLGGFFIATAMEKWHLHKRIALGIIDVVGTSTQRILLGFMLATAFLSMWVSNTAAVMMMIPMALAITAQVASGLKGKPEERDLPTFEKSLIFGVGYAGTIGGVGTLIGTPPNIILAAQARVLFGVEITFAGWMAVGVPVVILLLSIAWLYIGRVAFPTRIRELPGGRRVIHAEREALGRTSFEEKAVAAVFVFAAFLWISRGFIWADLLPEIRDGMIAVTAALLLFAIPAKSHIGSRILDWSDAANIPWGILLLFGGGLAIAAGFRESGLAEWIGTQLTVLEGLHLMLIISCATLLILFLTEITSNTATATMILPVVAALALALKVHPYALMIPCAMAANFAFMLPVGTPPNAIIFATNKLTILEMVRTGILMNLIAAVIVVLMVYFLVPLMWSLDFSAIPASFR